MIDGYGNRCLLDLLQDHEHDDSINDISLMFDKLDLDNDGVLDYNEFL